MTLIQLLNTVQLSANKVHNCMNTERVSRPVILGLKTDLQYISIKETNYFYYCALNHLFVTSVIVTTKELYL